MARNFVWTGALSFASSLSFAAGLSLVAGVTGASAATDCTTTGSIDVLHCSAVEIQMIGGSGESTLTVNDSTSTSVAVLSSPFDSGPFHQTLNITGVTYLSRLDYPAVYMYSSQPGWNATLMIGSGVTIHSSGPFGAVWLRSESNDTSTSNVISVESSAAITTSAANSDGISATSNNGPVSITNHGSVTVSGGRGLYADGGSASLSPVIVQVHNTGSIQSYQAAIRAINYRGSAIIRNSGSATSTTRQGLVAWSGNGGAEIDNTGTVVAHHYDAIVATGAGGNVIVTNSGSVTATRDPSLSQVSPGFHGISVFTGGAGMVSVTNRAAGTIVALADAGISAMNTNGAMELTNDGRITASTGMFADTRGSVMMLNRGLIEASSAGMLLSVAATGSVTNAGTIHSAALAFNTGAFSAVTVANDVGAVAYGNVRLGYLTNMSNAGYLALREGTNFAAPVGSGSVTHGSIAGNFTQASTGTLDILVTSAAQHSTLDITGSAALAGTIHLDVRPTYASGNLTGVITAVGGITDNGIGVTDNSLRYSFTPVLNGNSLDILVTDTGLTSIADAVAARSAFAVGAGAALDQIMLAGTSSPELIRLLNAIASGQNANQVAGIVHQALPLFDGQMIGAIAGVQNQVGDRIRQRFSGAETGFWFQPYAANEQQPGQQGRLEFDTSVSGMAAGADGRLSQDTTLGFAVALGQAALTGADQSADVQLYQVAAYGQHALDGASSLLFQLDAGKVHVTGERAIDALGLTAASSYTGYTAHAGLGFQQSIELGTDTTFVPTIRLDYAHQSMDGYTETGAGGAGLIIGAETSDVLSMSFDGTISHAVSDQLVVDATVGASLDLLQSRSGIEAAYAGAPATGFNLPAAESAPLELRAGLSATFTAPFGLEATADAQVRYRGGALGQSASLSIGGRF